MLYRFSTALFVTLSFCSATELPSTPPNSNQPTPVSSPLISLQKFRSGSDSKDTYTLEQAHNAAYEQTHENLYGTPTSERNFLVKVLPEPKTSLTRNEQE